MNTKNVSPKLVFSGSLKTTINKLKSDTEPIIEALYKDVEKFGIQPAGPLEFIYRGASEDDNKEFDLEIALPVTNNPKPEWTQFDFKETSQLKCISNEYKGGMEQIAKAYTNIFEEIVKNGIQPTDEIREVYQNWVDFSSDENIVEIQIGIN